MKIWRLGSKLIEQEADLDKQFASQPHRHVGEPQGLHSRGWASQGTLRETHVKYHLSTDAVLNPSQMAKYAELRGYGGGTSISTSTSTTISGLPGRFRS